MNKDESLKCFQLSQAKFSEGDLEAALRLAVKAQRMCESSEIAAWLEKIKSCILNNETSSRSKSEESVPSHKGTADPSTSSATSSASFTETRQRSVKVEATSSMAYTPEQVKEIKDFLKRDKNDYYGVLGVSRTSSMDEIKRAYKKLALKFHPDKNQAPGADEAFKLISVAVSTLSDEDKKRDYDRFGVSDRSSSSGFGASQANFSFNGGNGEISPEELFNMLFNSAFSAHQNPFAGSTAGVDVNPQFFFSSNFANAFHPPRRQRHARRNPQSGNHEDFIRKVIQFAPLLIIFLLSMFSSWIFGNDTDYQSSSANDHLFSLNPSNRHRFPRWTRVKSVPYYATNNFQRYFEKLREGDRVSRLARELDTYENLIERTLLKDLTSSCQAEERLLAQKLKRAKKDQIEEIKRKFRLDSCERLKKFKEE